MKKALILISFTISFLSCTSIKTNKTKKKYFEGIVTYNIDYESFHKNFTRESLKETIGSKMILTFKNGNYKKEFFSPDGKLLNVRFLDLQKNRLYGKLFDNDTIFFLRHN